MMNESYGFGSFRNKIWLRHSKNLAPEYQIGYHRIFLPLVKKAKTEKIYIVFKINDFIPLPLQYYFSCQLNILVRLVLYKRGL